MDENMDIEKIMNVVNIVKNLSSEENNKSQNSESANEDTPPLEKIKAVIPYLDNKYQKNINLMIRFIELDRLFGNIQALSTGENRDKPIKILQAVKGEMDIKKQRIIDVFVRVIEIRNLMEDIANG